MLFRDKVAVVTGGSGIGRAAALALARDGAAVVLGNRNVEQGQAVVREIESHGGRASFKRTDVSKIEDVRGLIDHAVATFGRLDLAFNNAGAVGPGGPVHEQDEQNARQLFEVNFHGLFWSMKYEIAQMLRNPEGPGRGAVVNCSSVAGLNGFADFSIYAATKHAVIGLTRSAALEYAQAGIRVNAVAPGPIETPMLEVASGGNPASFAKLVPMKRLGRPEEVAEAVVWLLSDAASYVTGHALPVDGGYCAR